jgi:hypothetical protein
MVVIVDAGDSGAFATKKMSIRYDLMINRKK